MGDFKEEYLLSRQEYGLLYPYVAAGEVRSVFWNGRSLWVEDENRGKYIAKEQLTESFLTRFAMLVGNLCEQSFGPAHPVLTCRRDDFYLEMVHADFAVNGTVLYFRKKEHPSRPDARSLVESGFCGEEAIAVLKRVIKEGESFLLSGPGGSGKKSLLRFMSRYFSPEERVICLDSGEGLRLASLNPDKDVTELVIRDGSELGRTLSLSAGLRPHRLIGSVDDGRCVIEWIKAGEKYPVSIGLLISCGEGEDPAERLFSRMEERCLAKMRSTMIRVCPVWIELDRKGLKRIVRQERNKKESLYERKETTDTADKGGRSL